MVDRIDPCPPDQTDVPYRVYMKMVRDRRRPSLWYVSGNATVHHTLDDNVSVSSLSVALDGGPNAECRYAPLLQAHVDRCD